MAELQQTILSTLDLSGVFNTAELAHTLKVDHQVVVGSVKSIELVGEGILHTELVSGQALAVTSEAKDFIANGSHEAHVFAAIPLEGVAQSELMKAGPWAKIGFSKAMSSGWISMEKRDNKPYVLRKVDSIVDTTRNILTSIDNGEEVDANTIKELKKRKLIETVVAKSFTVTKGANFTMNLEKLETDLTADLMQSGEWKTKGFKPYNFNAMGVQPNSGHLHPLLKVRAEFRSIFLEMGFTEMPTNNFVESSFWNFDALFQPQQHPARDCHDTFFLKDPVACLTLPDDGYVEIVKDTHQTGGGLGSIGYRYDWKIEEAQKNLLRTHTTAVSARMLRKLALNKPFQPAKYFSIDRVFRNETVDATHLAEFHQIEGVMADYNITLGDLIGVLYQFFSKSLGIKKLRFKPAYNPYTEPSMEIFSYHEGLGKWVEIGNSGMFRPEMLEPMGLPKGVAVIAWGLSLERPTMIKYKVDNIRELVGHKVNLDMVYNNAMCRLLKE